MAVQTVETLRNGFGFCFFNALDKNLTATEALSEPLPQLDLSLSIMVGLFSLMKCYTTGEARCSSGPEGQAHYSLASHYTRYFICIYSFHFILLGNRIKSPFAQRTKGPEE